MCSGSVISKITSVESVLSRSLVSYCVSYSAIRLLSRKCGIKLNASVKVMFLTSWLVSRSLALSLQTWLPGSWFLPRDPTGKVLFLLSSFFQKVLMITNLSGRESSKNEMPWFASQLLIAPNSPSSILVDFTPTLTCVYNFQQIFHSKFYRMRQN